MPIAIYEDEDTTSREAAKSAKAKLDFWV